MALTPNSTPPNNPLQLATLSDNGTPPRVRLSSAFEAQNLFWTIQQANLPRMSKAARIQGMFDGNPPFDQGKRRNQNDAWRSNFNSLEASSRLEAAKTPFYDLLTSSPEYCECTTDVASPAVDAATATRVRSANFDTLLRSFAEFDSNFWLLFNDFVAFNRGFLWWPTPDSWHFQRLPWYRVHFPDGTSTNPDDWEVFAIEHRWPAHKLYKMAHDAPKDAGWNFDQVVQAIRFAAPDDMARSFQDPMRLQQMMRDSDLYMSSRIGVIQAASVYTREFDGKWSRMMVETSRIGEKIGTSTIATSPLERANKVAKVDGERKPLDSTDWLYNKPRLANNLREILAPFIFEANDGSINEVSGLGKKIISISQVKDRLLNSTVDNTFMRGCVMLQATSGAGQAKAGLVQMGGGYGVLPPGFNVQPATIFGDITGSMAVSQDLDNRLDKNTGIYRPSFEKPTGNPESATANQNRMSMATVLSGSAVNRFYVQEDKFMDEVYRRVTLPNLPRSSNDPGIKAAIKFQDDCVKAGLTKEQCFDRQPGSIRAMRSVGNGSPMMRQQAMQQMGAMVNFMGPIGLRNYKIDYAAAISGQKAAERYFPVADTAQVPDRDVWDATIENDVMNGGGQPLLADWQDQQTHAQVHLLAGFAAVKAALSGGDPSMPFAFLQIAMPHIGQHIQKVQREQFRKELAAAYQKLAQGAQQVMQAAKQHAQAQGQQQQMSLTQQLEVQQVQHDIQIKDAKAQAQMKQRQEKQQFDMQLQQQQTAAQIQLEQQKAAANAQLLAASKQRDADLQAQIAQQDAMLKDAQTAHDITVKTASAAADIKIAHAKAANDMEVKRKAAENKPKASE